MSALLIAGPATVRGSSLQKHHLLQVAELLIASSLPERGRHNFSKCHTCGKSMQQVSRKVSTISSFKLMGVLVLRSWLCDNETHPVMYMNENGHLH
jgi:hypothetical protein